MALSNWGTLAMDKEGKSINGVFKSPQGVVVRIYKNWIYVEDANAWQDGGAFVEPTIMEIQEGILTYKDTQIIAKRGPQNGVYCVVYTLPYRENFDLMTGIGCYWVGVEQASVEHMAKLCTNGGELFEAADWMVVEEVLHSIDFSKALRFNQGDEYFAVHAGVDTPATEIGKAEEPAIMKMLK
jgi:hypothetical protein